MSPLANIEYYAEIVSEHFRRRSLRQLGTEIAAKSCDGFTSETIIGDLQRELLKSNPAGQPPAGRSGMLSKSPPGQISRWCGKLKTLSRRAASAS